MDDARTACLNLAAVLVLRVVEIPVGANGSAHVWLGELPTIEFETTRVITTALNAGPGIEKARRAGIELFLPLNHSFYALLCADFIPDDFGQCNLRVPVSPDGGDLLSGFLTYNGDEVRAGLPEEYARSVLDAASAARELLGSGILTLGPAAHSAVGSSTNRFSQATSALIEILALNPEDATSEKLEQIIGRWVNTR